MKKRCDVSGCTRAVAQQHGPVWRGLVLSVYLCDLHTKQANRFSRADQPAATNPGSTVERFTFDSPLGPGHPPTVIEQEAEPTPQCATALLTAAIPIAKRLYSLGARSMAEQAELEALIRALGEHGFRVHEHAEPAEGPSAEQPEGWAAKGTPVWTDAVSPERRVLPARQPSRAVLEVQQEQAVHCA